MQMDHNTITYHIKMHIHHNLLFDDLVNSKQKTRTTKKRFKDKRNQTEGKPIENEYDFMCVCGVSVYGGNNKNEIKTWGRKFGA